MESAIGICVSWEASERHSLLKGPQELAKIYGCIPSRVHGKAAREVAHSDLLLQNGSKVTMRSTAKQAQKTVKGQAQKAVKQAKKAVPQARKTIRYYLADISVCSSFRHCEPL